MKTSFTRTFLVVLSSLATACAGSPTDLTAGPDDSGSPDDSSIGDSTLPSTDSGTRRDSNVDSRPPQDSGVVDSIVVADSIVADSIVGTDSISSVDAFDAGPETAVDTSIPDDATTDPGSSCAVPWLIDPGSAGDRGVVDYQDTSSSPSHARTFACGSGSGPEFIYEMPWTGGDLWLETLGSSYGTLIELRTKCDDATSVMACSNKTSDRQDSSRIIYRNLPAGTYYLIVASTTGAGGTSEVNFIPPGYPTQTSCTTSQTLVSDIPDPTDPTSGVLYTIGADIWDSADAATMSSNVQLRPGPGGIDTCLSATGTPLVGRGPDQIYRLTSTSARTLTISATAESPTSFSETTTPPFDVIAYLRNAAGAPHSDATLNCEDSASAVRDSCVRLGTAQTVPAGDYFLVFDTSNGSTGRYHMHVDVR